MNQPLEAVQQTLSRWAQETPYFFAKAWTNPAGATCVEFTTNKQYDRFVKEYQGDLGDLHIRVLADPTEKAPLGTFVLKTDAHSLFRTPERTILTTDIDKSDGSLRGLHRHGNTLLVQLCDGTMGWLGEQEVTPAEEGQHWNRLQRIANGEVGECTLQNPQLRLIEEARKYIGLPYVLGGRSSERMDCSGLTSRVFRDRLNWILPRHSTDQRKCGIRVTQAKMRKGDLIFARLGKTNIPHVGFVSSRDREATVIHASQRATRVVEESVTEFFEGYRFMGVRRLIQDQMTGE